VVAGAASTSSNGDTGPASGLKSSRTMPRPARTEAAHSGTHRQREGRRHRRRPEADLLPSAPLLTEAQKPAVTDLQHDRRS
jgi:hypothetical protein